MSQQCAVHHSAKREARAVLVNGGEEGEAPLLSERRRGEEERWRAKGHFLRGGGSRPKDLRLVYEMVLQRGRGRNSQNMPDGLQLLAF